MSSTVRIGALLASAILFLSFLYLIFTGADKGQYITVAVVFVFAVLATRLDDITRLDYFYWLTHGAPPNPTQLQLEGFTNFQQNFPDAILYNVPSIASVEDYLRKYDLLNGEMAEKLKDWKQYEREGTHRRLDLWDSRHDLPK